MNNVNSSFEAWNSSTLCLKFKLLSYRKWLETEEEARAQQRAAEPLMNEWMNEWMNKLTENTLLHIYKEQLFNANETHKWIRIQGRMQSF
jgi:hypothetical protein